MVSEAYRLLDHAVEAGRNAAWRRGRQPSGDLSAAVQGFAGPSHSIAGTSPSGDPAQVLQTLAQLAQPIAGIAQALSQMHAQNTGTDLGSVWPVPRWDRVDMVAPSQVGRAQPPTTQTWEPIEPEDDDDGPALSSPTDEPVQQGSTSKLMSAGFNVPGVAAEFGRS